MNKFITCLLTIVYFLVSTTNIYAVFETDPGGGGSSGGGSNRVDISSTYAFGDLKNLGQGVDRLVLPAFSIAALGVIFYFLIGAFKYITSGGEKEELAKARGMITHSIIGFILLMALFFVIEFLFGKLFGTNIQFIKGL